MTKKKLIGQFDVPILLVVFNRPAVTRQVFDVVKQMRPKYLYVAADGYREHVSGEKEKCEEVRHIFKDIDWDCDLNLLFSDINLGCGTGPQTGITWFFENVERGIILEDDCVAHTDFFTYSKQMLDYYQNDNNVMIISGNNFQNGKKWGNGSYYFSSYASTWGWATWRRVWDGYDFYLDNYKLSELKKAFEHYAFGWNERQMWIDKFLSMKKRGYDAWDYQFLFHIWRKGGFCINPNVNLVTNIGLGEMATHEIDKAFTVPAKPILPIVHPQNIEKPCISADENYYEKYLHKNILQLIWRFLYRNTFMKPKFERY